jgi:hypothetical protein
MVAAEARHSRTNFSNGSEDSNDLDSNPPICSIAARCDSGITWPYSFNVALMSACRRCCCRTVSGAAAYTSSVARP